MDPDLLFRRFQGLQAYAGWTPACARLIAAAAPLLTPHIPALVEDFYDEIGRHPGALKVITGGPAQVERLKGTLARWIAELLAGDYGPAYVARRWRVGWRHVEIGLDQAFTNVAMSRLRSGLIHALHLSWAGDADGLLATAGALNRAIDLDLALIEDAYQAEYMSRLAASERMAAIGQVAGGIAHELRNPLNVVKTSVYYLLNARNPTAEKKAEHLRRIERQVALADGVITSLSNFARMPMPDLRAFHVGEWVTETLADLPPPGGVEVSVECPPTLRPGLGDPAQVRIALSNLIRNAFEAMPNGGRLHIQGAEADGHVQVAVRDTGAGMAPEVLARVMEPLFSTKARGLGLGLAIARTILEKNRGSLRAESAAGQGSTFTMTLLAAPQGGTP